MLAGGISIWRHYMEILLFENEEEMGRAAASMGAAKIRRAVEARQFANIVVATGVSQFSVLGKLAVEPNVPWHKVHIFHLDEYVGLSDDHEASFRRYLNDRFVSKLPAFASFEAIVGDSDDIEAEVLRLGRRLAGESIDVCFAGIGDNGHLAFNDPPADFRIVDSYHVVTLDEACRHQQVNEGWFESLSSVPSRAISMSIRQILKSDYLIVSAPGTRKSVPVRDAIEGQVTPELPASILQQHRACSILLDPSSAALLTSRPTEVSDSVC